MTEATNSKLRVFDCPSCGAPITIRGLGQTSTVGCIACGSVVDFSSTEAKLIAEYENVKSRPLIPLGTRGKFEGQTFEMIGYLIRSNAGYFWGEYLLFNPYLGFRWLVEAQGHWSFVTPVKEKPEAISASGFSALGSKRGMLFKGEQYRHFIHGQARVEFVFGEFYWQVRRGQTTEVDDYVAPPAMLSVERDANEQNWSYSVYKTRREIEEAFQGTALKLPRAQGVGANQPNPFSAREIGALAIMFLVSLTIVQFAFVAGARDRTLFDQAFTWNDTASKPVHVVDSLVLQKGPANVLVSATAPVDNSWMSYDVTLSNKETGEEFNGDLEVAYYHGVDGGESWSEGSNSNYIMFGNVPQGNYSLAIEPSADARIRTMPYQLKLRHDVPYWKNYLAAFFLMGIWPFVTFLRGISFEKRRWMESDYAPGESDE